MSRNSTLKPSPFRPRSGCRWKTLSPVSKKKHRRARRFVPDCILDALEVRSNGWCECYLSDDRTPMNKTSVGVYGSIGRCPNRAEWQPHHIKKRSRGGRHTMENLIRVCARCHEWIESHDKEAINRGLSRL